MTKIVDTSSSPEHRGNLEAETPRRANVIFIVYSISAPSSFDRIPTYWLPYIRSLGINVPVILVGNKIDLNPATVTNAALEDELAPVMAYSRRLRTCVECSARIPLNVSEVFYFAQKAVLYLDSTALRQSRARAQTSLRRCAQAHISTLRLGQGWTAQRRGTQRLPTQVLRTPASSTGA